MQLQLKPYHKNSFPIGGVLVRSSSVMDWLMAVQELNLTFDEVIIYPIPANTPNSIWGCIIIVLKNVNKHLAGKYEFFQVVSTNLFIAERAILYPAISLIEIQKLFAKGKHIFHPDFGLVELTCEFKPDELIIKPTLKSFYVSKPVAESFIPQKIGGFRIEPISPEDALKNLEDKVFPQKEAMKDKPLNILEKAQLLFYRQLFNKSNAGSNKKLVGKTKVGHGIERLLGKLFGNNGFCERMQEDFEELDRRNQKEVDKLLDLLMYNPEEALKYAIPLDNTGGVRGGDNGQLSLFKRWMHLSWAGNSSGGAVSGTVDLGDRYFDLQKQYMATAETLVNKKKYHDAAFVYMKLLKSPNRAAEVLETGKHYHDAATIYIKHTGNKRKAAECYERGNMTIEAIDIYKELKEDEKVGDLYLSISRKKEADIYYNKVADGYSEKNQFVKASLVYKNKIGSISEAQLVLLRGWQADKDAVNCLSSYFANIADTDELKKQIHHIYLYDRGTDNGEKFLYAIKHVYDKCVELSEPIREMAYEIIAANVIAKPSIVSELKFFNPNDKELMKDTLRYKVKNKKVVAR